MPTGSSSTFYLPSEQLCLDSIKQRMVCHRHLFCLDTCACFYSSSFCGSRGGCLRRRRKQPSEASGPGATSPRLPCPPGSARFLDSADLERRRFLFRCLLHLEGSKTTTTDLSTTNTPDKEPKTPPSATTHRSAPSLDHHSPKTFWTLTFFIHVIWYSTKGTDCLQKTRDHTCISPSFLGCRK